MSHLSVFDHRTWVDGKVLLVIVKNGVVDLTSLFGLSACPLVNAIGLSPPTRPDVSAHTGHLADMQGP